MTTINGQPPVPPVTPADQKIDARLGEFLNGGSARHHQGHGNQNAGGNVRSQSSLFVSQSALEKMLETPDQQPQSHDDTADDSAQQDTPEDVQLLITLTPEKMATKEAPLLQTSRAADQMTKIDDVAKMVTRQMDAALRSGPMVTPHPISLAIPLDAATGLKEVKVMLNDGVLSVTIVRDASQADQDIKQAALNLAHSLQARYPTKTIKVAQKVDDPVSDTDAPAEISDRPAIRPVSTHFLLGDEDL